MSNQRILANYNNEYQNIEQLQPYFNCISVLNRIIST